MVAHSLKPALRYAEMGVRSIAVHIESEPTFGEIASILRGHGVRAIAALRHSTPVAALDAASDAADGLLFLTAPAGGGEFDPGAFERLAARPRNLPTMVDGRIEPSHFSRLRELDVDLVVVGATLFSAPPLEERAAQLSGLLAGTDSNHHTSIG
jgi:ribulose-phosphate 3-epimerase